MYNLYAQQKMASFIGPAESRGRSMSSTSSRSRSRSRSASTRTMAPFRDRLGGRKIPRSLQTQYFDPFPSKMQNKMRYVTNVTLNANLGDDSVLYSFSCNNIHDPDVSGVGHQPFGHDSVALLYNHYRVDKAVCRIRPTTAGSQMVYGLAITDQVDLVPTSDLVMCERKNTKFRAMSTTTVAPDEGMIVQTWKPGLSFVTADAKDLAGSYTGSAQPTEQMYFVLFVSRAIGSATALSTSYLVEIDYYVTSYELKQLSQS